VDENGVDTTAVESCVTAVRAVLRRFQEGYQTRDLAELDAFMDLFVSGNQTELIGIGATERGGYEWFQGSEAIRGVIESDWTYWGDVTIDIEAARISVSGEVSWLSTTGRLRQTQTFDQALMFYLEQMKGLLDNTTLAPDERMMEATHYGLRRLRERDKGQGHVWPFVLTAVLLREKDGWRFHMLHWSMPVD
jgi:hypothetical protein